MVRGVVCMEGGFNGACVLKTTESDAVYSTATGVCVGGAGGAGGVVCISELCLASCKLQ